MSAAEIFGVAGIAIIIILLALTLLGCIDWSDK